MEHFQNYQVGTWISNGLIVRSKEMAEKTFSVVKSKLPTLLTVAVAAGCAATIFLSVPKADFSVSRSGESHSSSVTESLAQLKNVEKKNQAASSEQIESLKMRMNEFRARLSSRNLGLSSETLQLAKKARQSSDARSGEHAVEWATRLIQSENT
jgi:16S rRNA A1518/A1519 N6-dimethyltransferase RsmA/KsgA/DIM1 with predicted DNA glycosylase/AP lyase activity